MLYKDLSLVIFINR